MDKQKITIARTSVGPAHDPYSRETITVERGTHTAEWEVCGLAGVTVRLYVRDDTKPWRERDQLVREYKVVEQVWNKPTMPDEAKQSGLKAELLFARHVGLRPNEAEDRYYGERYAAERANRIELVRDHGFERAMQIEGDIARFDRMALAD